MRPRPELRDLIAVPSGMPPLGAADVEGSDLVGRPRTLRLASPGCWTLLLFLGSHCDGCAPFWTVPRTPSACGLEPQDAAIVVTRGPGTEVPAVLATLMGKDPPDGSEPLCMSDTAWRTYRVHGAPFYVLLDGVEVATEGVAWSLEQVSAEVARARRSPDGRTAARA
ncbi:MAG: hypothetical protein ACRDXC_14025 [Acidimicrobiales bacterium]